MWKKYGRVRQATDDNIIPHIKDAICDFASPITKAGIQTHTQYLILTAFPLQQWLCECATLHYTYDDLSCLNHSRIDCH